jgi:hypothetical protein
LEAFSRLPIHPTTENRCGVVGDSELYVQKTLLIPARIMAPHRPGSQDRGDGSD